MNPAFVATLLFALHAAGSRSQQDPVASQPSRPRLAALIGLPGHSRRSAENDVALMRKALIERGIADGDIVVDTVSTTRDELLGELRDLGRRASAWSEGDFFFHVSAEGVLRAPNVDSGRAGILTKADIDGNVQTVFWDEVWTALQLPEHVHLIAVLDVSFADRAQTGLPADFTALLPTLFYKNSRSTDARQVSMRSRGLGEGLRASERGVMSFCAARALATASDASSWFDGARAYFTHARIPDETTFRVQLTGDRAARLPGSSSVERIESILAWARAHALDKTPTDEVYARLSDAERSLDFGDIGIPKSVSREFAQLMIANICPRMLARLAAADSMPLRTPGEVLAQERALVATDALLTDRVRVAIAGGLPDTEKVVELVRTISARLADARDRSFRVRAFPWDALQRVESAASIDLLDPMEFAPQRGESAANWRTVGPFSLAPTRAPIHVSRGPVGSGARIGSAPFQPFIDESRSNSRGEGEPSPTILVWRPGSSRPLGDYDVRIRFRMEGGRFGLFARANPPYELRQRVGIGHLPPSELRHHIGFVGDPDFSPKVGSAWEAQVTVIADNALFVFRSLEGDDDPYPRELGELPKEGDFGLEISPDSEIVIDSMQIRLAP